MRATRIVAGLVGIALLAFVGGCQTDSPGMKNTLGTYSTMMDARPDQVTKAAERSVKELKLVDVTSTGTRIDGKVTAKTAQNESVIIDIEQAGENVSKVSVRVGTTGDEAVSRQIVDKIKGNLHWF